MAEKTFDELLSGAQTIRDNELPESNTHALVGEQLVNMVDKIKEEDSKLTELSSESRNIDGTIESFNISNVDFLKDIQIYVPKSKANYLYSLSMLMYDVDLGRLYVRIYNKTLSINSVYGYSELAKGIGTETIFITNYFETQQENYKFIVTINWDNLTNLVSNEGKTFYIRVFPYEDFFPYDKDVTDINKKLDNISTELNYFDKSNIISISDGVKPMLENSFIRNIEIEVPEELESHTFTLTMFGYNDEYNRFYIRIKDKVTNIEEGYGYKDYESKPSQGIEKIVLNGNNGTTTKGVFRYKVTVDWSKENFYFAGSNDTIVLLARKMKNKLYGKHLVSFGDSITWYNGKVYTWGKEEGVIAKGYQYYLEEQGMIIDNQGESGWTMPEILTKITGFTNFEKMDYMTLMSGANDTRKNIPIGEVMEIGSDYDVSTYIGAIQKGLDYALSKNPTIKICLFTPIPGWIYAPDGFVPPQEEDKMVSSSYAEAVKLVGKKYSIPVLDLYNNIGYNIWNRNIMMNDPEPPENNLYSLHPSTYGYKRFSDLLIPFLKSI